MFLDRKWIFMSPWRARTLFGCKLCIWSQEEQQPTGHGLKVPPKSNCSDNMEMKTRQSPSVRFMVIISVNWRRQMDGGMFVPLSNLQYVCGKGLCGGIYHGLYWNVVCRMRCVGYRWPLCFPKCPPFMEERLHTVRQPPTTLKSSSRIFSQWKRDSGLIPRC